jgi:hypothetical protein
VPFTLAHAAAALPFRRTRLILPALIVGTFAPDFEYFLQLDRGNGFGHTILGAFVLDLPLALAVLWLYQHFVRTASISLLPNALRVKLSPESPQLRLCTLTLTSLSVLIGIATHLAWDQFTHFDTYPHSHWSFFSQPHQVPLLGYVQNYKLLQHGSTLIGSLVLALWFLAWFRRTPPVAAQTIPANPYRGTILVAMLAVAAVGAFLRAWVGRNIFASFIGRLVVTFIPLLWLQLVAYGIWLDRRRPSLESI